MPLAKKFKKSSYRYKRRKNYYSKSKGKNYRRKNKTYTGILTGFGDYHPVYKKKKSNSFFSTVRSGVSYVVNTLYNAAKYLTPIALTAIAMAYAPALGRYAASLGFTGLTDFISAIHENKYLQHVLPETVKGWLKSFSEGVSADTYDLPGPSLASERGLPMDISEYPVVEESPFELEERRIADVQGMPISEPYSELHDLEQRARLRRLEKREEEKSLIPVPLDIERYGSMDPSSYQSVNPVKGFVFRGRGPSAPKLHKWSPIKYTAGGNITGGVRKQPSFNLRDRKVVKKPRMSNAPKDKSMDESLFSNLSKKYFF